MRTMPASGRSNDGFHRLRSRARVSLRTRPDREAVDDVRRDVDGLPEHDLHPKALRRRRLHDVMHLEVTSLRHLQRPEAVALAFRRRRTGCDVQGDGACGTDHQSL